jgi:hypothetical protein
MMSEVNDTELFPVLDTLGIGIDSLLGQGSEAWVFALDGERIARINRAGTTQIQADGRIALLSELGHSAKNVPFAIPTILDTIVIKGYIVTIENRLPGRPLTQALAESAGEAREALVRAYLEAVAQIGNLTLFRPWYGDLSDANAVRADSFRVYLQKRAEQSLKAASPEFETIDPVQLAAAFPEPDTAAFVHLDAFPGNVLVEGEVITAVIDFGASAIIGDRRLDPLTAAVYLSSAITPTATDRDRSTAQEWLAACNLADLFPAVQNWIAAYWSFAQDDISLYQWCRTTLLG